MFDTFVTNPELIPVEAIESEMLESLKNSIEFFNEFPISPDAEVLTLTTKDMVVF